MAPGKAIMLFSRHAGAVLSLAPRNLKLPDFSYLAASARAYRNQGGIDAIGTSDEISRRYPRKIELDASLVPPGPQFLRIRPAGQPHEVQPVSLRLMGAAVIILGNNLTDATSITSVACRLCSSSSQYRKSRPPSLPILVAHGVRPTERKNS